MANQSEIISILSSGVNYYRLLLPYLGTSILLGALSFYLNAYVVPHAVFERLEFEAVYVKNYRPWEARDIHKKITNNTFIYVHAYNQYKKEGTKFTIEEYNHKNLKQKIVAEKARWQPQTGSWKLEQVQIRTLMDSNEVLIFLPFLDTIFELKPDDIYQRENLAESFTLTELIKFTEQERERGSEYLNELILEQHERIAYPFASIILTVIGFSLSTTRKRGGIALQLGIGFVLTFIYLIIQTTAKAAFADSAYPGISMWVPNLIYIVLALFLLRIAPK
jgi:lipopolysaccharide export system permease protein